jgi:Reverse transcriptase (RNA-dependent DNA polymerase)
MAFTHTKKVDIESFIKARIRIRSQKSVSGSGSGSDQKGPDPDPDPQHCSLYSPILGTDENISIEEFLGQEIANNPIVQNSKLSFDQREALEHDLTLEELDWSMQKARLTSAGGMDGISNRVLKKFWCLFRQPLFLYAKAVGRAGRLTQSFKLASIRLIPKKGDLSKLKNWRPISLVNCVYKIISRAINNRLQQVAPTILSRAQKGFVKNRYIQEILIDVIENISYANHTNTPGLVIAIDQSRAFDTILHSYMDKVYQFFGFGPNFSNMLNTIGTNRSACLIWDNGTYSVQFDLKTGRTQGDGPSPLQYNFGEQVLIFKLELNPSIRPMIETAVAAVTVPDPLPWFRAESKKETKKVEALANDTTALIKNCRDSLRALKPDLEDFSKLSGLVCNFEKTFVMPVGGAIDIPVLGVMPFWIKKTLQKERPKRGLIV